MDIDPDHFGPTSFFNFFILIIENNSFHGSSKAYKYQGFYSLINNLYAINNDHKFLTLFKNIYPEELKD